MINEDPLVRAIGPLPSSLRPVVFDRHLRRVADSYNFQLWSAPTETAELTSFVPFALPGWTLTTPAVDQFEPTLPGSELVVRLLWRQTDGPKQLITTHVYVARRRLPRAGAWWRCSGVSVG